MIGRCALTPLGNHAPEKARRNKFAEKNAHRSTDETKAAYDARGADVYSGHHITKVLGGPGGWGGGGLSVQSDTLALTMAWVMGRRGALTGISSILQKWGEHLSTSSNSLESCRWPYVLATGRACVGEIYCWARLYYRGWGPMANRYLSGAMRR